MVANVALFGRRELEAHKRFLTGVTASVPAYIALDTAGAKEFVVDVYLGSTVQGPDVNILRKVPIAPYAKELVTDIRQPVTLTRSKQGKWEVVGREKLLAAGTQTPEGTIFEPTFHSIEYNLAALGLTFIADLDHTLEVLQATPGTELQADPGDPLQEVKASDAFGLQIFGPGAADPQLLVDPKAAVATKTRHTIIQMSKLGPKGDPDAMDFGVSVLQPAKQKVVELIT